jgi:cytochrome c oxidase assembly protein subunit 15
MFLYPLARMTGPIYLEHAHRLFGSLVGLTTLVLAIRLAVTERRARIKAFAFSLLVLVIAQGILGGLRVTGRLTMSQSPDETAPSLALAVVHGVMAQLFLGCMVALAVMTTDAWQGPGSRRSPDAGGGEPRGAAGERVRGTVGDARLAMVLVVVLFMQLVLGALQRHFARGLSIHLMLAGMVAILAYAAGARAWGKGEREPVLARIGITLVVVTTLQIALGFGALTTTGALLGTPVITMASVLFATAHQTMGAALLALAVALLVWSAQPLNARPPGSVPPASPPRPLPAGAHRAT